MQVSDVNASRACISGQISAAPAQQLSADLRVLARTDAVADLISVAPPTEETP
jgi:hypothetical protein